MQDAGGSTVVVVVVVVYKVTGNKSRDQNWKK